MFRADQMAMKSIAEIKPLITELITVLNSIHARQELMNEQLGKILYLLEQEIDIKAKYEEKTDSEGKLLSD